MLSPGRIRDPVHGYVAFTAIERALLDDPVAQRLRYVSQSAAAHLVFPEMRVSRMAHSLGAMHLASRFLAATLEHAGNDQRSLILGGFRGLVDDVSGLGAGDDAEQALLGQGLLAARDVDGDDRLIVLLVEQGLRLASLVHDLGHLPFSHDFELALGDHARANPADAERYPHLAKGHGVHEDVGFNLADVVQKQVFNRALAGEPFAKPAEISLLIARRILHAPAAPELTEDPVEQTLSWLHELIAGEIDVDRADYVLRDVRHYGLVAAGYDVDRLVDYLTVVSTEGGALRTAVLPQGVSAAESFLVARFRMYSWAVYHHKVQQAAAGLRVAIGHLLADGGEGIRQFLEDVEALAAGNSTDDVLDRFVEYDDVWWLGLMRAALPQVTGQPVEPWLALFLRRRPGPVSLWKRPVDFPAADRRAWNRRLPADDDLERRAAFDQIRRELREDGVLVERLPFRPWKTADDGRSRLQVVEHDGALRPLSELSPLVRALEEAWLDELQVFAFAEGPDRVAGAEVLARLDPALLPEEI